ncbi:carbohydrate kinase [Sporomusaceae bacterium FL31]|nr:carbohydrate kinase [Sporomusaceae bacterium FL31]GCE33887.1 carbohydrate kinase [Sporomusaceae bacterium]
MVITLGSKGAIYYNISSNKLGYQPVVPVEVVDTSGAGDAFFSGTVMGLIKGRPLAEAVIYGTKVAAWTIESDENTCAELSLKSENDAFFSKFNDE